MELEELTLKGYDLGKVDKPVYIDGAKGVLIVDLLVSLGLTDTLAEAKRLIVGRVVKLNGVTLINTYFGLSEKSFTKYKVDDTSLFFLAVGGKEVMLYLKKEKYENSINN